MNELSDILLFGLPALALAGLGYLGVRARRGRGTTPDRTAPRAEPEVPPQDVVTPSTTAPSTTAEPAPEAPATDQPPAEPAPPTLERPEPAAGRMVRLRGRLARSGSPIGVRLLSVLSRDHLSEDDWDEIEETLLLADVGAGPSADLVDRLREQVRVLGVRDVDSVRGLLREQLLELVDPSVDRSLATAPVTLEDGTSHPAVVLVVGVNGTGKTTTVGKFARVLVADGRSVVLGAADTFRAAAADQLQTWGARVGVPTVRSDRDGADPAAVAFDAVHQGLEDGADVVLVDTAGRLQNKAGLMDELGKITRVLSRKTPLSEVLLVLDATTGQNGMNQARVFAEVAGVTGIVLTKLDGTAKGGIVVAVQRELGVPVKLVGLGEGPDDLAPFEPEAFVDGLLEG
ncbi:signal recognition particle-docking protein FtsY [Cellulomonas bogoriensis]|uniref:Signal recognition particle receptor FtsY n=1 Tax=Cellulomonas bogoriensis 69B4 = DSM 16987 TaxID=1386082 RepID=A0A0A0C472_9CELL|nr:signal recognition particle-docking protein FtsY [Cellulomonas bogoriensis]KGM14164.1 cell division protein FtsY [Cellulomonas bogoriensis 69B4 = DSM 16987]